MKALFSKSFIVSGIVVSLSLFQPSVSHAGMLGDLWGSVVGFFTGKNKNDPAREAQIATLLEQTNQSQNSLIASINEMLSYQKGLQDLNKVADRQKMDAMMQSMQESIQSNQDNFLQLMQLREQLEQSGDLQKYEQNIGQFIQKQQEIEEYYPKIEDRFNELLAYSEKSPTENAGSSSPENNELVNQANNRNWENESVQAAIDEYLEAEGLDEWGGPKVENSKIGRPPGAGNRSRYQYLWEANPKMREALSLLKVDAENDLPEVQEVIQDAESSHSVDNPQAAPARADSSFNSNRAPKATGTSMAFTNRYDNVDLRNQRKEIYGRLIKMQNAGEMSSEAYKDLYHEYTILGQKLNKASN